MTAKLSFDSCPLTSKTVLVWTAKLSFNKSCPLTIGTRALTTNIGDHPYLAWTTDQNHNGGFYGETLQEWRSLT